MKGSTEIWTFLSNWCKKNDSFNRREANLRFNFIQGISRMLAILCFYFHADAEDDSCQLIIRYCFAVYVILFPRRWWRQGDGVESQHRKKSKHKLQQAKPRIMPLTICAVRRVSRTRKPQSHVWLKVYVVDYSQILMVLLNNNGRHIGGVKPDLWMWVGLEQDPHVMVHLPSAICSEPLSSGSRRAGVFGTTPSF